MSLVNRAQSPITRNQGKRKRFLVLEDFKIHRVRLISPAVCTLAQVISPNCIWFKLLNDVTDQLQYVKPRILNKRVENDVTPDGPNSLKPYDYVMAPLEENIYARARIVCIAQIEGSQVGSRQQVKHFAYAFFIDEGFGVWLDVACLAVMDQEMYTHPWQSLPVALFKAFPGTDISSMDDSQEWSDDKIIAFQRICEEYEYFRVAPVHNSNVALNTYYEYPRAEIYGLPSPDDETGESIGHQFAVEIASFPKTSVKSKARQDLLEEFFDRSQYDAAYTTLMAPGEEVLTNEIIAEIPRWRRRFPKTFDAGLEKKTSKKTVQYDDKQMEIHMDQMQHWNQKYNFDWDPDVGVGTYPTIESPTMDLLVKMGYCKKGSNRIKLNIQWNALKTPHDFFAFPMKPAQEIAALYEEHQTWASNLDSFYADPSNRIPINQRIVRNVMKNRKKVFAIYEWNDEITNSSFRRVQILSIRDPNVADYSKEFCRIRFIDHGGHDIIPLVALLAIHSKHCKAPPMCLQLCLRAIMPQERGTLWSDKSCNLFYRLARSDMPMTCELVNFIPDFQTAGYTEPPRAWPGVANIERMKSQSDKATVEETMFDAKLAYPVHFS
ncbi:Tudor domain containing protein [Ditylenchus destructor]|uniref:Tudor domain containing protein n=1 Tax=Ditylenchus destructor TaxID=166010 RepID=A0AAD4MZF7_9BILA|nr:Tudor domain containing protein [Ditylenchus destructor]